MRAKYLCGLAVALSTIACRAPQPEPGPATATREDVVEALHSQLELVIERRDELAPDESAAAQNEREILAELAVEIAVRIVQIDPHARLDRSSFPRSGG